MTTRVTRYLLLVSLLLVDVGLRSCSNAPLVAGVETVLIEIVPVCHHSVTEAVFLHAQPSSMILKFFIGDQLVITAFLNVPHLKKIN